MTGPIVCGVDFSDDSKRALAWARLMADRLAQPLIVVHAVEPLLAEAARVTYGRDALEDTIAPELRTFVGSGATALEIGAGDPARVINGTALAHDAAMIVVGTQGLGRASRMWFGSTTMRLLRESTRPVLGVPPRATDQVAVSDLLVGTDFSTASAAALDAALQLAARFGVPVTCLHVVRTAAAHARWNDVVSSAADAAVKTARRQIGALSAPATGVTMTTDVRTGDAAEVLIQTAEGRDTLIVVGLGGDDPARRPGTTAYRVISGADAPVLAVPAR